MSSSSNFFRGSGRSPWYIVAISTIGSSISGVTFLSVPGMVAASQFSYMQMVLGFTLGYAVVAFVLLPLYYRMNMNSIYGYLEDRFGRAGYFTGACFFLISKLLGCGVRMFLTASVLQLILFDRIGVPFVLNIAVTMLIVWAYTFRGGVKTIVWTDMLQTFAMIISVVLCIFYIGKEMGLDFSGLCATVSDSPMSRIWYFDDVRDTRFFWKQFLAGIFTTVTMTGLDQDMMQKNLSCKNLKDSRKNMIVSGLLYLPINLIFLSLGVLLYSYASKLSIPLAVDPFATASGVSAAGVATTSAAGAAASAGVAATTGIATTTGVAAATGAAATTGVATCATAIKPDQIFAAVATGGYMPTFVCVLFIIGLVSAAFSSAGSAVTALTTSFTVDILRADRKEDEKRLARTRMIVHCCGTVIMGFVIYAFRLIGSQSVINAVYMVASFTYGPLLGIYAFGMFTKFKPREWAVPVVCILSPVICLILHLGSETWFGGYRFGFEMLLINGALTFAGLLVSSIRHNQRKKPRQITK